MAQGDRRRNNRAPCRIRAEIHAGAAFSQVVPLTNISEDGFFAAAPPVLSPGTRATARFMHPSAGRLVTTRAVVARREGMGESRSQGGMGFYLTESLTALGGERRSEERSRATLPARIRVGNMEVAARIVDVSDWGGRPPHRSRPQAGAGRRRRSRPSSRAVRPPPARRTAPEPGFHHPGTRRPIQVEAVLARNPKPVAGRPEYELGIRFNTSLTTLMGVQSAGSAPTVRTDRTRITGAANLDRMATMELNMRSLLRSVEWDAEDGSGGEGRVVLAGKDRLLVATLYDPPPAGQVATVTLQTHEDSSSPPLPIQVEIMRSGASLVGGREPGFVAKVRSFYSDADAHRFEGLVSWLSEGPAK